jgi:uncharacterized protein (DUF983 family)
MAGVGARLGAVVRQRCPRCLQGRVFTGLTTMLDRCPVCGHRFEREPGYFLGAMYASYFMSIPILGLLTVLIGWLLLPSWSLEWVVPVACVPYLFLTPLVYRYARVIWMHMDPPR